MKFTLSWLKEHLETDASVAQIVSALTAAGLEVESVDNPAEQLAPFTIARVLTAERHPQADKLQVLRVDTGAGAPVQVVCGAPNARAGLVGVFGAPGAYVPGSDITLKVAAIRGVESCGMMCSERELLLSDSHDGIIELPEDAPVGALYAQYAGLDDVVIDVSITPNRQDCMGVAGIARDLAALGLGTLKTPTPQPVAGQFDCALPIVTEDSAGCPAFLGRVVKGVRNGPSPDWMQKRLRAIGQKPISALVDITNYIMFDRGRPLHVYDLAKIKGGLVARKARMGETVEALNGKIYALTPEMTVIADKEKVHDIGGIMGGMESGVGDDTTDIIIECAYFTPEHIGATGRALGLTSDARARFERGVDPAFLEGGMALATQMVLDICGGTASHVTTAGQAPCESPVVAYRPEQVQSLAGMDVPADKQVAILTALGFGVVHASTPWQVRVPSWRRDVDGAADLVEEIVRITGLDHLPSTPLPRAEGVARPTATFAQRQERQVRRAVAARGLQEAVTWSFIAPEQAAHFGGGAWTLANPISADLAVMRPSLLPGLLAAAQRNMDRSAPTVRLFELGRRYLADAEKMTLGLVLAGHKQARDWRGGAAQSFDAYDAKAEAVAALAALDVPVARLMVMPTQSAHYHPGRSGQLCLGPKQVLAEFGELHPALAKAFGLKGAVMVAEIFLDALVAPKAAKRARPAYAPPSLQPVHRDFAFLMDANVRAEDVLKAVRGAEKQAIVDVALFDVFTGAGVPEGQKSMALQVTLQPLARSFTDEELEALSQKIVTAVEKAVGARLRG